MKSRDYMPELIELKGTVNRYFKCDITSKSQKRHIVYARKVYCKLAKELYPNFSYGQIGLIVNRDHATVYVSIQTFHTVYDYHKEGYENLLNLKKRSIHEKRKDAIKLALHYRNKLKTA